jgi:hypothetical protein
MRKRVRARERKSVCADAAEHVLVHTVHGA